MKTFMTSTGQKIDSSLANHLTVLRGWAGGDLVARQVWDELLTVDERSALGGEFAACYREHGTIGMWQAVRRGSMERAILEIAHELGQVTETVFKRRLRQLGEAPPRKRKRAKKSAKGLPSEPVVVDRHRGRIVVDGREYDAQPEWCSIVQCLIKEEGDYVHGRQLQEEKGCKGKKIWKSISQMETAIPEIKKYIEHAHRKGYRFLKV